MRGQAGFFDLDDRLRDLSAKGDALERLSGSWTSSCSGPTSLARFRARTG
jgi:hypothetical protein